MDSRKRLPKHLSTSSTSRCNILLIIEYLRSYSNWNWRFRLWYNVNNWLVPVVSEVNKQNESTLKEKMTQFGCGMSCRLIQICTYSCMDNMWSSLNIVPENTEGSKSRTSWYAFCAVNFIAMATSPSVLKKLLSWANNPSHSTITWLITLSRIPRSKISKNWLDKGLSFVLFTESMMLKLCMTNTVTFIKEQWVNGGYWIRTAQITTQR